MIYGQYVARCQLLQAAPLLSKGVGEMPTIIIARGVELNPNHFWVNQ